jgi:hypothetical protein
MKTRTLTNGEVEREPYRVWNAYVDLLAVEDHRDLVPEQRAAYLVFWYESEVQNGGHLQYFENRGTVLLARLLRRSACLERVVTSSFFASQAMYG